MKKQYRFLTMGALTGLLLTGVMPQAQAQDLDGTQFGGAEVNNGDVYEGRSPEFIWWAGF